MRRGMGSAVATLLVVGIMVFAGISTYAFVNDLIGERKQAVEGFRRRGLEVKDVSVDCDSFTVEVTVRNAGTEPIEEELYVQVDGRPRYFTLTADPILSEDLGTVRVPILPTDRKKQISLGYATMHRQDFFWPCALATGSSTLAFVADPGGSRHWPVYDYVAENYSFYASSDDDLAAEQGPENGSVPVIEGEDNYTIQTSSSSWSNRPVDSPVVLVRNPHPREDWVFNWTDPHGQFNFSLPGVEDANRGYLIFWEDQYNPFDTTSLDDWKDHVVRVTFIPPNTYRIALYLAKGGYRHQFFLLVSDHDPLSGSNPYNKSGGVTRENYSFPFHHQESVFYVTQ